MSKLQQDPHLPDHSGPAFAQRLTIRLYDLWRQLVRAINERVTVEDGGTYVASQPTINFIEGTGVTITIAEDTDNGKINVTISSP